MKIITRVKKKEEKDKIAKIIIGYDCNNNCVFCYERKNKYLGQKNALEIKEEMKAAKSKGFNKIHFIGGEPTIRPDLVEIINYAYKLKFNYVYFTTNGRMLSYLPLAKQIIKSKISYIIFSIHGGSAKTHDNLTRVSGSFSQATKAIKNLQNLNYVNFGVNYVITKDNYHELEKAARLFVRKKISRVEFLYISVLEKGEYEKFVPRVSNVFPFINKAIKIGEKSGYHWLLRNAPIGCYFNKIKNISGSDSRDEKLFVNKKKFKQFYTSSRKKILNYIKIPPCKSCRQDSKCLGVLKNYIDVYGYDEVKPIL